MERGSAYDGSLPSGSLSANAHAAAEAQTTQRRRFRWRWLLAEVLVAVALVAYGFGISAAHPNPLPFIERDPTLSQATKGDSVPPGILAVYAFIIPHACVVFLTPLLVLWYRAAARRRGKAPTTQAASSQIPAATQTGATASSLPAPAQAAVGPYTLPASVVDHPGLPLKTALKLTFSTVLFLLLAFWQEWAWPCVQRTR